MVVAAQHEQAQRLEVGVVAQRHCLQVESHLLRPLAGCWPILGLQAVTQRLEALEVLARVEHLVQQQEPDSGRHQCCWCCLAQRQGQELAWRQRSKSNRQVSADPPWQCTWRGQRKMSRACEAQEGIAKRTNHWSKMATENKKA